MTKRERPTFTAEFKKQIVQLYQNGKTKRAIIDEYDLTPSSLDRWIHQDETFGSGKLATPFTTITFDEVRKDMYLADRSALISVYKYGTLDPTSSLRAYGKIDQLVYVEETDELYAFTKFNLEGSKTESTLLERFKFGE